MSMSVTIIDPRVCVGASMLIEVELSPGVTEVLTIVDDTILIGPSWYLFECIVFSIGAPCQIRLRDRSLIRFDRTVTFVNDPFPHLS